MAMINELKEVAARIKELREIAGLSPSEMSLKTEVTLDEYLALEKGETDFSFTFIYKCAAVFGVEIKDLLEGISPLLATYTVTRKGEGLPITRRTGFTYNNLAPSFKHKTAEPFWVKIPYDGEQMHFTQHAGQEIDIVIKGSLKIQIDDRVEVLTEGDTIYYNSGHPHALCAVDNKDCEIYAIVLKDEGQEDEFDMDLEIEMEPGGKQQPAKQTVADEFIDTTCDENGVISSISFKNADRYNFGFDTIDKLADKSPNKVAMVWVSNDKEERYFTFGDLKKYSAMTANYFASLGIKKGDRVMLVLKNHYQFWYAIIALHKMCAIIIPATNQLVEHDFTYRYKSAGVKAIVCTADGDVAHQAELAAKDYPNMIKIIANGSREGWHNFDEDLPNFSDVY